jgi:hypothetical protein
VGISQIHSLTSPKNTLHRTSISEEQAAPAVFPAAMPSAAGRPPQELRFYWLREPTASRAWQHLHGCLIAFRHRLPHNTIILPLVLYDYETWSLALREEHRLRLFENRVLRRTFGPKWNEVTRRWRKLHNEELRDLYSSPRITRIIKSRRMRWAGHVARMGKRELRICYWWESQREKDR